MSGRDRPALLNERTSGEDPPGVAVPPSQPPQSEQSPQLRGWLFDLVQRTFVLVGIYVLSIGPMYWHWYGGRFAGGSQIVAAFYEPIFVLASFVPWFGEWMDWYVSLWIA